MTEPRKTAFPRVVRFPYGPAAAGEPRALHPIQDPNLGDGDGQ